MPISNLNAVNLFLKVKIFQVEILVSVRLSIQKGEWVTLFDFSNAFSQPLCVKAQKSVLVSILEGKPPIQSSVLWSFNSSYRVHYCGQGSETHSSGKGYRNVPDYWLVRTPSKKTCHQDTQTFLAPCQDLDWIVNTPK